MKYCLCFLLIAAASAFSSDTNNISEWPVLVRLVKVSHSKTEMPLLFATFEPISIGRPGFGGGGANGPGAFSGPTSETVIGKQFTKTFAIGEGVPHEATIRNVVLSCEGDRGALKLHLVLSIPEKEAKELDIDQDFSQWIIVSVDVQK